MDKNKYISNKIKKLMDEGKSQAQSVAIAYSMYEREKMQEGGIMQKQYSDKMRPILNKELAYPILKVEYGTVNGVEGYKQFYTDPSSPDADYSFLSKEDYMRKKNAKQGFDYEPYLQMYLKKSGNRENVVVKYEEGGEYLPKYQGGGFNYQPPFSTYNLEDYLKTLPQSSTKSNPIMDYPTVGSIPTNWDFSTINKQDSAHKVVDTQQVSNSNTNNIQKNSNVSPITSSNSVTYTPVSTPSNSDFYRGQFMFNSFNPLNAPRVESELGYESQAQGFGYKPEYKNTLSPEAYNAGQEWASNNPLPEGIFQKDLNYERQYIPEGKEQSQEYRDFVKYNILNSYGGVDPMSGLTYGLYNLGAGEGSKATLGLSRFGIGALREGLSAYGAGKSDRQVMEDYRDRQFNSPPKYEYRQEGGYVNQYMQEGGKTVADIMTGNYIMDMPQANVEVEDGEYVKNSQTGNIQEAVGKKHADGGVKVSLPSESKVLSDFTKIGAENAKKMKEMFEISVKPKDTFADVLDKYKKKIGAEKLEQEEVEMMEALEKQLKANINEKTKQINLDFLGKELEEIQQEKSELQKKIDDAFEVLFNEQEKIPKKGTESAMMQEGGEASSQEAQMQEIYQMVVQALQQGQDPNQVAQELINLGVPQELVQQIISEVMQQAQEVPTNEEGMPIAQEGLYTFSTQYTPKVVGYDVNGKAILDTSTLSGVETMQPYTGKGYGAKMSDVQKTIDLHNWYFDTEEKKKAFIEASKKEGEQPEIKAFQEAYNKEIKNRAKKAGIADSEVENIVKEIGFTGEGVQKFDGKFGAFTSSRPLFDFSKKDGQPQVTATPTDTTQVPPLGTAPINRQVTKNIVPLLPYFPQLPPDAMMMPKRQQVDLSRIDPAKIGVEPNLAEAERARIARAMSYVNLSPEVASAMQSADLMATQQANNQAISAMEVANAQAQFQADQFNAQQRDREQLTNLGLDKQYEREMFATKANQERDWRAYFNAEAMQQKQNYMDIQNLNLVNAMTPNYQYNPNTGVEFVNPYMFNNNQGDVNKQLQSAFDNAKTPEERNRLMKNLTDFYSKNNA